MSANNLVPVKSQMPAHLQEIFGVPTTEDIKEFSGGVKAGFPVLSFRGKAWRVRKGGEEVTLLNEREEAVQSIDVVLVQSSAALSKIFYDKKYSEGDNGAPRCWSGNGVRPDSAVQNPIAKACAACPNNAWGSRITESGKKTRACGDNRRMAVLSLDNLDQVASGELEDATPMLLRVPPASLNTLKTFVETALAPKGIKPYAVFVRIGFDTQAAHPQLTFKPMKHPQLGTPFLSREQAAVVMKLRDSDEVKNILAAELEEYSAAGTTDQGSDGANAAGTANPGAAAAEAPTSAPAASTPAKPAKKRTVRPAAEEEIAAAASEVVEVEEDVLGAATAAGAPAAPALDTEDEDILSTAAVPATPPPAAAAKPKPRKAAATAAPAAAAPAKPAAAPVPAAGAGEEDFDSMLSSILNS